MVLCEVGGEEGEGEGEREGKREGKGGKRLLLVSAGFDNSFRFWDLEVWFCYLYCIVLLLLL